MALTCLVPPRVDPERRAVIRGEFRDVEAVPRAAAWITFFAMPPTGIALAVWTQSQGRPSTTVLIPLILFAGNASLHTARSWRIVPRFVGAALLMVAAFAP